MLGMEERDAVSFVVLPSCCLLAYLLNERQIHHSLNHGFELLEM